MHVHEPSTGRLLAEGYVHPELAGRGAGMRLLAAAEARASELAQDVPPEVTVTIETAHPTSSATHTRQSS